MRLTLRTLLAWLDDTLPAAEVRQIGQQVSESPLAGELVDKIHRVTRQRRLTVPPGTGPDGVDANIVAGYIGDELPAEVVAEYEKRCLTSDVTLAEVASVHQILSLLGQKAKVPVEARERMYHLVKGREAVGPATPRTFKPKDPEPVPLASWTPPPEPARSPIERYGPLAAVAALIAILCWSAYVSVGPAAVPAKPETGALAKAPAADKAGDAAKAADKEQEKPKDAVTPKATTPEKSADKPETSPDPAATTDKPEAAPADTDALPAGAVGVLGKGDHVLLRYNATTRKWDRLAAGATLRDGDRIMNLPPFFTPVQIGSAMLTMIGDTELTALAPSQGTSARFELTRGRLRVHGTSAKEPIALPFDAGLVKLVVPAGATAGLERLNRRAPGDKLPSAPGLRIIGAEGSVAVECGAAKEDLTGASVIFHAPNVFVEKAAIDSLPAWLTELAPSAAMQERGKTLAAYLKPDRSPVISLVEAVDHEDPGVRADAITALAGIGSNLDLVVSSMSKKDDPASRRAAIAVLRDVARRDAKSAQELRAKLEDVGGSKQWADDAEAMLVGYSAKEAGDEATAIKLVGLLKHEDVGIRELAIETLQAISRRGDRLGYDPDKPNDPAGVKAWQDVVQRKELRVPAAPKTR
jgi:hypothetical protein